MAGTKTRVVKIGFSMIATCWSANVRGGSAMAASGSEGNRKWILGLQEGELRSSNKDFWYTGPLTQAFQKVIFSNFRIFRKFQKIRLKLIFSSQTKNMFCFYDVPLADLFSRIP